MTNRVVINIWKIKKYPDQNFDLFMPNKIQIFWTIIKKGSQAKRAQCDYLQGSLGVQLRRRNNRRTRNVWLYPGSKLNSLYTDSIGFSFKIFLKGSNSSNAFWDLVSGLLKDPSPEQIACHAPKPILLDTGEVKIIFPFYNLKIPDEQSPSIVDIFPLPLAPEHRWHPNHSDWSNCHCWNAWRVHNNGWKVSLSKELITFFPQLFYLN